MKLLVISGGSKGLGLALSKHYAALGYDVIDFSRSGQLPGSVHCDFSVPVAAAQTISQRLQSFATTNFTDLVVISNAATLNPIGPCHHFAAEQIATHINIGFTSAILFMTEAVRAFASATGRKTLISISSGVALRGVAGWSLYCASKAGLENYIRAVAAEQALTAQGFRAINIDPGVMDTEMQAYIRQTPEAEFPGVQRFHDLHANNGLRQPASIARAIAHIVSLPTLENGCRTAAADYLTA